MLGLSELRGQEEALRRFIDDYLDSLATKYRVSKPKWDFCVLEISSGRMFSARYVIPRRTILVNKAFIKYYRSTPKIVEQILRFVLAHEFYHHCRFRAVPNRILPQVLAGLSKPKEEMYADEFAEKESGVPREKLPLLLFAMRELAE